MAIVAIELNRGGPLAPIFYLVNATNNIFYVSIKLFEPAKILIQSAAHGLVYHMYTYSIDVSVCQISILVFYRLGWLN